MKHLYIITILLFLSGCAALTPITTALSLGEAHQAVKEDKEQPTTIKTVITKDNGEIVVRSDSPKSLIQQPIIPMQPTFDTEKAVSSVPTWLKLLAGLSGILFLLNTVRHHYNKKKEVTYDSNGTDYNGWWRTHGWRVQIHGPSPESQSRTTEDADANESAESGHRQSGERVRIQVGGRRSE